MTREAAAKLNEAIAPALAKFAAPQDPGQDPAASEAAKNTGDKKQEATA